MSIYYDRLKEKINEEKRIFSSELYKYIYSDIFARIELLEVLELDLKAKNKYDNIKIRVLLKNIEILNIALRKSLIDRDKSNLIRAIDNDLKEYIDNNFKDIIAKK